MKKNIQCLLSFSYFLFKANVIRKILFKLILKLDDPSLSYSRKIMLKYYDVKIGKYSYGCQKIDGSIAKSTIIGDFCSIAPGVRIGGMNHPTNFLSTHPFLYYKNRGFISENNNEIETLGNQPVCISDDVWIGQNAIILPGVTVMKGAVIGAGSVVTRDVPPYTIVAGVPAKPIKKRFSDKEISILLDINWCKMDDNIIKENISYFYNVSDFIERFRNNNI